MTETATAAATPFDSSPVPDYPALHRLDGLNYIVLGAGLGIGRQTVHALAQAGARVFCVDLDAQRAHAVASEVGGVAHHADCTDRVQVERLVEEAERRLGRIDGFVDIVGMAEFVGFLDITDELWDRQFDLNLRHCYLIAQVAGRRMVAHGGSMLFVASISGLSAAPLHAAYGAAKSALGSLVKSLATELSPFGVRVNAVAPGAILTPRRLAVITPEMHEEARHGFPLGRRGEMSEIASAALFLSSPMASYITGQNLVVDGGVTIRHPSPRRVPSETVPKNA